MKRCSGMADAGKLSEAAVALMRCPAVPECGAGWTGV